MFAEIEVRDGICIDTFKRSDLSNLVKSINHPEIAANTLMIPHPYNIEDGKAWLSHVHSEYKQDIYHNLCVRKSGKLIGGIGLTPGRNSADSSIKEVGYWLGASYWRAGIMTEVLSVFTTYAFDRLNVDKLEAHIFDYNQASARVLAKCGYNKVEKLPGYYKKQGVAIDGILYSKYKLT